MKKSSFVSIPQWTHFPASIKTQPWFLTETLIWAKLFLPHLYVRPDKLYLQMTLPHQWEYFAVQHANENSDCEKNRIIPFGVYSFTLPMCQVPNKLLLSWYVFKKMPQTLRHQVTQKYGVVFRGTTTRFHASVIKGYSIATNHIVDFFLIFNLPVCFPALVHCKDSEYIRKPTRLQN